MDWQNVPRIVLHPPRTGAAEVQVKAALCLLALALSCTKPPPAKTVDAAAAATKCIAEAVQAAEETGVDLRDPSSAVDFVVVVLGCVPVKAPPPNPGAKVL